MGYLIAYFSENSFLICMYTATGNVEDISEEMFPATHGYIW